MGNYIAYYSVSTQKQGKSGLGIDAQKTAVKNFLSTNDFLIEEFTDVESGKTIPDQICNRAMQSAKCNLAYCKA